MQEIGIESSVLTNIRLGLKTVEGRLGKPKFLKLRVGDELNLREDVWENGAIVKSISSDVNVRITQILYFETFQEMLESINYRAAVPYAASPSEAAAVYRKYYSAADEQEYGVVALTFTVV